MGRLDAEVEIITGAARGTGAALPMPARGLRGNEHPMYPLHGAAPL